MLYSEKQLMVGALTFCLLQPRDVKKFLFEQQWEVLDRFVLGRATVIGRAVQSPRPRVKH